MGYGPPSQPHWGLPDGRVVWWGPQEELVRGAVASGVCQSEPV